MPLLFVKEDILRLKADIIVNPANRNLRQTNGICSAVFAAAGAAQLSAACAKIGSCPAGEAVITPAFNLSAKYIIHAVGPLWINGFQGERAKLVSCYEKALALAAEHKAASIAFPLLSAGAYGYPREKAFEAAVSAIAGFLKTHDMIVYLYVFDNRSARPEPDVYNELLAHIANRGAAEAPAEEVELPSLDDMWFEPIEAAEEVKAEPQEDVPFIRRVLTMAKERGFSEQSLCYAANMSKTALSRLRNHPKDRPDRKSAAALCVALGLSADEARDLLSAAGLFLSNEDRADLIADYFLRKKGDIFAVNAALYALDEPQLFSI